MRKATCSPTSITNDDRALEDDEGLRRRRTSTQKGREATRDINIDVGGLGGIRTHDRSIKSRMLCQLSYQPRNERGT